MRIDRVETLRADAAWRSLSFLKIITDCVITGWSEDNKDVGSRGRSLGIEALAPPVIGADPRASDAIVARLHAATRQARGGINRQAIAAVENALCDIRGKEAGTPGRALFGGPIRERIPVSWAYVGTDRVAQRGKGFLPDRRTYDDLAAHAAEVKAQGFRCLKTNRFRWRDGTLQYVNQGFGRTPGWGADSNADAVRARPPRT
jgi:L-alanine-DL-glutamate epimerase-like enolase superfamily enzyme